MVRSRAARQGLVVFGVVALAITLGTTGTATGLGRAPRKAGTKQFCADAKILFADAKDYLEHVGSNYVTQTAAEAWAQQAWLARMAKDAPSSIAPQTRAVAHAYSAVKKDLIAIHFNPANPVNGPKLVKIMEHFGRAVISITTLNKEMYAYIQQACGLSIQDVTPTSGAGQ